MKIQLKELLARNIGDLGEPKRAHHCDPDASVTDVLQILRKEKIGSIVVVEDRQVVGIFTERDYLEKVALNPKESQPEDLKVKNFMTRNPVTVKRQDTICETLTKMRKGKFRHVVIVDSYKHLEKVVSMREIMDYLLDSLVDLEGVDLMAEDLGDKKAA